MIFYKSPYIGGVGQQQFIFKLQGSGTPATTTPPTTDTPIVPECSGTGSCDGNDQSLGVISCDPGSTTNIQIKVVLPGEACETASECSVTSVLEGDTPVTNLSCTSDPSLTECPEGCLTVFQCSFTPVGDANCEQYTAQVSCSGGTPASCENNVPN